MRKPGWKSIAWLAVLVGLLFAEPASAQINHSGVLDNVLSRFQSASSSWGPYFVGKAQFLFFGLALISMVWTFGTMALKNADLGEIMSELIRFVIFFGLFSFFLTEGVGIAAAIIDSMVQMGSTASGFGEAFTPSHALNIGFQILNKVAAKSSVWHPVDAMAGMIVAIVLLIVLAMTMINVLLVQISLWIVAYAGIFILGFGGSRWTSDIAINYFKSVFGIALSLMGMILVIGVGLKILDDFYATATANTLQDDVAMLVIGVCLFILSNKIPGLLVGMVTGSSVNGAAGLSVATAGNVASAAIAAATAGAGAAAAGAAQAAGGASAIQAAFQGAQSNMANGTGAFSGSGGSSGEGSAGGGLGPDGGGGGGGEGASAGGAGGGGGGSPLSSAMGGSAGGGGGGGGRGGGRGANDNGGGRAATASGGSGGAATSGAGSPAGTPGGGIAGAVGEPDGAAASSAEDVVAATAEAGSAAEASSASGEAGDGADGASSGSDAGGGSSGRSSMATAGLFAADMAANLGGGIARTASNKMSAVADSARARVAGTVGGQIANEIRNPGAAAAARAARQGGGDTLSPATGAGGAQGGSRGSGGSAARGGGSGLGGAANAMGGSNSGPGTSSGSPGWGGSDGGVLDGDGGPSEAIGADPGGFGGDATSGSSRGSNPSTSVDPSTEVSEFVNRGPSS